jgi:hypothetical protein
MPYLSAPPSTTRGIVKFDKRMNRRTTAPVLLKPRFDVRDLSPDREFLQANGLGFSLKSLIQKVTAPVLKVQQQVQNVALKLTPKPLRPLVSKIQASERRVTESTMNPLRVPELLKQEAQQIKATAKTRDVQIAAAAIAAAAAIYFTGGAASPAVMALLKAAADRTAAKKAAAQNQQEADAAQAEFDAYAKSLAAQTTPPAALPYGNSPGIPGAVPSSMYGDSSGPFGPDASAQVIKPQTAGFGNLPTWAIPVMAGVALIAIPLSKKGKRHGMVRRRGSR